MNLWRRSKSWFLQESFPTQKENFEPQDYLEQEKQLLKTKYEHERDIIEKHFHYEMLEAKLRFENELRRLEEEHLCLKAKNKQENDTRGLQNATPAKDAKTSSIKTSPAKKNTTFVENGLDGLEWDPINELKSYSETDSCWEAENEISFNDSLDHQEELKNTELRDSAYGSIQSFGEDSGVPTMKKFKASDVERKIDQLRSSIRQEITRAYDEKFREERKFLYSVIDELEENVALLRKQKEDIVTIFEAGEK